MKVILVKMTGKGWKQKNSLFEEVYVEKASSRTQQQFETGERGRLGGGEREHVISPYGERREFKNAPAKLGGKGRMRGAREDT